MAWRKDDEANTFKMREKSWLCRVHLVGVAAARSGLAARGGALLVGAGQVARAGHLEVGHTCAHTFPGSARSRLTQTVLEVVLDDTDLHRGRVHVSSHGSNTSECAYTKQPTCNHLA